MVAAPMWQESNGCCGWWYVKNGKKWVETRVGGVEAQLGECRHADKPHGTRAPKFGQLPISPNSIPNPFPTLSKFGEIKGPVGHNLRLLTRLSGLRLLTRLSRMKDDGEVYCIPRVDIDSS